MTWRVCAEKDCPTLTESDRCPVHKRGKMHEYNRRRGSSAVQGYGGRWPAWAKTFLRAHPFCVVCGELATEADHKIPRPRGAPFDPEGHDRWANLQPMCSTHHKSKTMRETNARRARR